MRNILKYSFFLLTPLLAMVSCKKDGAKLILTPATAFPASATASVDSFTLAPANDNDTVITFSWPAVSYGDRIPVTYTLELDTQNDTLGTNGWAHAQTFIPANNVTHFSFAGKDLNNLLQTMGIFTPTQIVFRVLSNINQLNGPTNIPTVISASSSVKLTPYLTNLWVPGNYEGWSPSTAPVLNSVPGYAGVFEGYVYMPIVSQGFKYTNAPDWNHTNYGDATGEVGSGTMTTNGLAGSLSVATPGYYELSANLNTLGWNTVLTNWGILGDASPGGWNTDTDMTYDPVNQVWTVTCVMKKAGSFKFRANHAWVIDFGIDAAGNLQYADNPLFTYNPNLNNLTVPADGTYKLTLDLHVSGKYTYSVVLQ